MKPQNDEEDLKKGDDKCNQMMKSVSEDDFSFTLSGPMRCSMLNDFLLVNEETTDEDDVDDGGG